MKEEMSYKLFRYCNILFLLLWINFLYPEGFFEQTLVRCPKGLIAIEKLVVGDKVAIITHKKLQSYPIIFTAPYVVDSFVNIYIKDVCLCVAFNQKFYSYTRNKWISADSLMPSEQLLCGNNNIVCVDDIEVINRPQKMHILSVGSKHIFYVTKYNILVHNMEPGIIEVGSVVVSLVCPVVSMAISVGKLVAFGIASGVMYAMHKLSERNKIKKNGCYQKEEKSSTFCDIKAGAEKESVKPIPYEKPETINADCKIPRENPEKPALHNRAEKQSNCNENKRYDGPKYHRTEDWINEHPFGQKIKDSLERTDYINQGKRAFEVIKNLENNNGFKKGDFVVIDALHKDHLEVFGKDLKWKQVANLDGTKNEKKTEQGAKETRKPLKKG